MIDARTPTTSASTMIDREPGAATLRACAAVASSRVRCAIVIESEFAMTNDPTKSATKPNTSRKMRRKSMNSFVSAASDWICSARRHDLNAGGQDLLDLPDELRVLDTGLRRDGDLVELPLLLEHALRRGQVEAGQGRAADRQARAELHDSGDHELLHRPLDLDADAIARARGPFLRRGLLVDRSTWLGGGHDPSTRLNGLNLGLGVRDREPEVRRASEPELDHLSVLVDELGRLAVDAALGFGDAGVARAPRGAGTRRRSARHTRLVAEIEG